MSRVKSNRVTRFFIRISEGEIFIVFLFNGAAHLSYVCPRYRAMAISLRMEAGLIMKEACHRLVSQFSFHPITIGTKTSLDKG